jgi:hypothetical protein
VGTFKDSFGRDWLLTINVPVMKRVQDRTGYHLGKLFNDECKLLQEVTSDAIIFGSVLFAMVEPQAKSANVEEESFLESLNADTIEAAGDALLVAVQDFSPSRTRPLIAALRNKGQELAMLSNAGMAQAVSKIEAMTATEILKPISTSDVSASPESSESIPAN